MIDRVEQAVTRGDTDELGTFVELGELLDAAEAKKSEEPALQSIEAPVIDSILSVLICDSRYNKRVNMCLYRKMACEREVERLWRANRLQSLRPRGKGGDRRGISERGISEFDALRSVMNDLRRDNGMLRCGRAYDRCIHLADQKRTTCYWLVGIVTPSSHD